MSVRKARVRYPPPLFNHSPPSLLAPLFSIPNFLLHRKQQIQQNKTKTQMEQRQQQQPGHQTQYGSATTGRSIASRLQEHAPTSTQVVGFLTLLVSGAVLLVLTGLTVTAAVAGLLFFAPLILISSPVWVPAAAILFVGVTGFLSACGAAVAALAGATWMYRYFTGRHPVGSGRVDYARSRISDRAREVKDYAREHGIYFPSRIKDAAPGA